ncbi:Outer membrane porin protein 32 [Burkholderia sp. AD24]|nr:Outer membrane porin protein 32 [Burkholderia sp. AD24]
MRQARPLETAEAVGGAILAMTSGRASAQSSITLYGVADVSVRYLTHSNATNDGRLYATNGAITNSRWGLRGSEDLESGIDLRDGAASDRATHALALTGTAYYDTCRMPRSATSYWAAAIATRSWRWRNMRCLSAPRCTAQWISTRCREAASVELPGKDNQTGIALGLRTIF